MNSQHVLLIVLIFVNTVSAMKRKGEFDSDASYEKKNEFALFQPSQSLCVEGQQNDRFIDLFRIHGLPSEVQRLIAAHVFEDDTKVTNLSNSQVFEKYKNAADMFCSKPLCEVFDQYGLAIQIFKDPEKYSVKKNPFPLHLIFEYAHDLKINHEIRMRESNMCGRKELESVARVTTVFGGYVSNYDLLRYQCYDQPTISNFTKKLTKDQLCLLVTVLGMYVLTHFPDGCDYVPNQYNIELNEHIDEFNRRAASLYNKTGYKPFLGSHIKSVDNYTCVINNFGRQRLSAVGVMLIPLCYWLIRFFKHFSEDGRITNSDMWSTIKISSIGLCAWLFVVQWRIVPVLLSSISSCFSDGSLVGVGCIGLLYGLLCSGYNIYQMNRLREGFVRRTEISALLERMK